MMRVPLILICCVLVVVSLPSCRSSSLDSLPIASQFKSLVQVTNISDDAEGAKKTIENFVNTVPVVSEINNDVVNFDDKDSREHVDLWFGMGADVLRGVASKKSTKNKARSDKDGAHHQPDFPESPSRRQPDSGEFGAEPPNRGGTDEDFIHNWGPDDMHLDYSIPETLDIARRRVNLPDNYKSRLDVIDFRDVNTVDGIENCYFCTAAAIQGMTVTELMDTFNIHRNEVSHVTTIDRIFTFYRKIGFQDVQLIFQGNALAFHSFVYDNVAPGQSTAFALAFKRSDAIGSGHVVLMRVWKERHSNIVNYLTTDFQKNVSDPDRFLDRPPVNAITYYIIHLKKNVTHIAESNLADLVDHDYAMGLENDQMNNCSNKRIIGYLPCWAKHGMSVNQAARLTNIIYAFVKMDADGGLTIPNDTLSKQRLSDAFVARKALALNGLNLSVSFAVGGWENSQYFSNVVSNNETRFNFIQNIFKVLNDNNFDGVDIDWEYPGTGGATMGKQEDKENYVTMLRELREKVTGQKLISIAGAAGVEGLQGFDIKNIVKYVDWIGVMSYDLNGAWDSKWGAFVGPNSPLYHGAPQGYSGKLNIDWAIEQYVCKSKIPQKIILGIPFYGRYWSKTVDGVNPDKYPLFRKAERVNNTFGGDRSYRMLIETWLAPGSGFTLQWDDKSKTPWGMHNSSNLVLTYDNPISVKEKVNYAVEKSLGGVMIWSVDQDDDALSLTNSLTGVCQPTGNSINYKCNPLEEKRWWTYDEDVQKAGMCGKSSPLYKGYYPVCDPDDSGFGCCSPQGYCGGGPSYCDCKGCVDYVKNPEKLIAEPVKPSRKIQWHVGFDLIKAGDPRCGATVPPINGFHAICNPDDDTRHCCSPAGYCGTGPEFCDCKGCKDFRKISEAESLKKNRSAEQIRWHIGFDEVKSGEVRCGPKTKQVNGKVAICDPDDDAGYCCSQWGYCGIGEDYCNCKDCVNSRKIDI